MPLIVIIGIFFGIGAIGYVENKKKVAARLPLQDLGVNHRPVSRPSSGAAPWQGHRLPPIFVLHNPNDMAPCHGSDCTVNASIAPAVVPSAGISSSGSSGTSGSGGITSGARQALLQ